MRWSRPFRLRRWMRIGLLAAALGVGLAGLSAPPDALAGGRVDPRDGAGQPGSSATAPVVETSAGPPAALEVARFAGPQAVLDEGPSAAQPPLDPVASPAPAAVPPSDAATVVLDAPALLPRDVREEELARARPTAVAPTPGPGPAQIPVVVNAQVQSFLDYFQSRKSTLVSHAFDRARRYIGMMRAIFREKGLPEDLVNLAFIESAVNPHAISRAKAAGIWQFVPSTGRLYGMQTTPWVDERRDPEKSTRGAAEYLKSLYDRFGCWALALAAYNAGEGTLQRAIERQKTRDFWSLRLPKETRLFVPAFMAMTIISQNPEHYGFSPPAEEPYQTEVLQLRRPTDLSVVARAAGITVDHIRELNPELIRSVTPPHFPRYALRIPRGLKGAALQALEEMPAAKRGRPRTASAAGDGAREPAGPAQPPRGKRGVTVLVPGVMAAAPHAPAATRADGRHTVQDGETLGAIAKAHGVSVGELRRVNRLPGTGIRAGQVLRVAAARP